MEGVTKWVVAAAAGGLAMVLKILGGWDAPLALLFGLMGLDVVTGLIVSFRGVSTNTASGKFSSREMYMGLTRKVLIIALVILANSLDGLLGTVVTRSAVIGYYALNEAMSILENAAVMGVPCPAWLINSLQKMRERLDTDDPYAIMQEDVEKGGE
jgi:toxin secretion/phage lysis holin